MEEKRKRGENGTGRTEEKRTRGENGRGEKER